jgi:ELWxxDGT repeat protein
MGRYYPARSMAGWKSDPMTSVIFAANDGVKGAELWRLDSATGTPVLVKDINLGPGHSQIANITQCGNYAFFTAHDGQGFGLYRTDGTESGTVQLISLVNVNNIDMVAAHGTLYFIGPNSTTVFKSDGTPEGTVPLFTTGGAYTNLIGETAIGMLFQADGYLWQTDGTAGEWQTNGVGGPAQRLAAFNTYDPGITVNGVRFLTNGDPANSDLWRSDGTVDGSYKIDVPGVAGNFANNLVAIGGTLYFLTSEQSGVKSLWRSDGTNAGTLKLRDLVGGEVSLYSDGQRLFIASGGTIATSDGHGAALTVIASGLSGGPSNFRTANGITYFNAFVSASSAVEPWRTDGTAAGTHVLKDVRPGLATSNPAGGIAFEGKFIFSANDGIYGQELWISDGTTGGTVRQSDIGAINRLDPSTIVQPISVVTFQNASGQTETVFIAAEAAFDGSGPGRRALYYSVGNGLPTRLGDISGRTIRDVDVVGSSVFFVVGADLYRYAGNGAPAELVKSDVSGDFGVAFNGEYYFGSYRDLWKSNGTSAGTTVVTSLGGPVSGLVINNGKLYLNASGPSGNLWITDGTAAGTILLRESTSGLTSYGALELTAAGNLVFFVSNSAPDMQGGDLELFATDGTTVFRVKDIWPGFDPGSGEYLASSEPKQLRAIGNTLYFTANNGVNGRELWKSDGTDAGTVMVKDVTLDQSNSAGPTNLTVGGNKLFFLQAEPFVGTRLWVSDGTAEGTTEVAALTGPVSNLTSAGGRVVFTYNNGTNGLELWSSDGTSAGTFMVADLTPGAGSTTPAELLSKDGTVFFSFAHPVHGIELWRTDGTAQGTFQVTNAQAAGDGNPYGFALIEANLPDIIGTEGADRLVGTGQAEWIEARGGDDSLVGGAGADRLDGGEGTDTADYTGNFGAVRVDLAVRRGWWNYAEGDTLSSIENITGTDFGDRLYGGDGVNVLRGGRGDDVILGRGGNDIISGGLGADELDGGDGVVDTVDYSGDYGAVWVDLQAGQGRWNYAHGDILRNFENITGTDFGDRLIGNGGANYIAGGKGDDDIASGEDFDVLNGGLGADVLDGGLGIDTADYRGNYGAVWVSLATGLGRWNYAQGDTYVGIENVAGSSYNDRIEGDARSNGITGGDGDDLIAGGAGADQLDGGAGEDMADYSGNYGAVWIDLAAGFGRWNWAERDMLSGFENVMGTSYGDKLHGSAAANKIYGGNGDDLLEGRAGNDLIEGGAGNDVALFSGQKQDYSIDIQNGQVVITDQRADNGDDGQDVLRGVETVRFGDGTEMSLSGAPAQRLEGGLLEAIVARTVTDVAGFDSFGGKPAFRHEFSLVRPEPFSGAHLF